MASGLGPVPVRRREPELRGLVLLSPVLLPPVRLNPVLVRPRRYSQPVVRQRTIGASCNSTSKLVTRLPPEQELKDDPDDVFGEVTPIANPLQLSLSGRQDADNCEGETGYRKSCAQRCFSLICSFSAAAIVSNANDA